MRTHRTAALVAAGLATLIFAAPAWAQSFKDMEQRVVEKTLPNGLKVILLPRPEAPVVSFVTYADVGGVNEQQNATGLAHIFEHMAFKGTAAIGSRDIAKERAAMAKEDQAFLADTSDEEATAQALRRALDAHAPSQVAARRALAERRFSWRAIASAYLAFFEEVVAARG